MSFLQGLKVCSSGLAAERIRMNVISGNIANANSTETDGGDGPYRRKDVVFTAQGTGERFDSVLRTAFDPEVKAVRVKEIVEDSRPPKRLYNPGHPDADDAGYVAFPNISVMEEMVNLITASRAFEANTSALNALKSMAMTATTVGRS